MGEGDGAFALGGGDFKVNPEPAAFDFGADEVEFLLFAFFGSVVFGRFALGRFGTNELKMFGEVVDELG